MPSRDKKNNTMKTKQQRLERVYKVAQKNSWICSFLIGSSIAISFVILITIVLELVYSKTVSMQLFSIAIGCVCLGVIIGLVIPKVVKSH